MWFKDDKMPDNSFKDFITECDFLVHYLATDAIIIRYIVSE